jgi:hypothetical protein
LSNFPRSPKIIKGALVAIKSDSRELISDKNSIFVFQYNPEKLTREISYPNNEDTIAYLRRPKNVPEGPIETIHLTLELDTTDQLEKPEQYPHTVENGLLPSLAVLESMISPSGELPVIIFQWGPKRTIPVRLTRYKITEEAFDQNLNPIRVTIDLCMQVLGSSDFKSGSVDHEIYENYKTQKEALALLYRRANTPRTSCLLRGLS